MKTVLALLSAFFVTAIFQGCSTTSPTSPMAKGINDTVTIRDTVFLKDTSTGSTAELFTICNVASNQDTVVIRYGYTDHGVLYQSGSLDIVCKVGSGQCVPVNVPNGTVLCYVNTKNVRYGHIAQRGDFWDLED